MLLSKRMKIAQGQLSKEGVIVSVLLLHHEESWIEFVKVHVWFTFTLSIRNIEQAASEAGKTRAGRASAKENLE